MQNTRNIRKIDLFCQPVATIFIFNIDSLMQLTRTGLPNRANMNKVVHNKAFGSKNPNPLAGETAAKPTGNDDPEKLQQGAHYEERKEPKKCAAEKLSSYLGKMVKITKTIAKISKESGKVLI
jgi:hypothetical protein